jgi:hypothetical protein
MMWRSVRLAGAMVASVLLMACELREVTFTVPDDVIVAEVILHAETPVQTAYLHRTVSRDRPPMVHHARAFVTDEARGEEHEMHADQDSLCLVPAPEPQSYTGTCYAARLPLHAIRPGASYRLRIDLPDRPDIRGRTTVPGYFQMITPEPAACTLPPGTPMTLAWTPSGGAWVYVTQARFRNLLAPLRAGGVPVPAAAREPFDLLGLAIGATDTTMAFPGGFGLFDRGDEVLHPILLAIRNGLPAGAIAEVVVAAADQNYVNWVRGGNFNPSGTVRVPSVTGGGTGVFGSLVTRRAVVHAGAANHPPCL